MAYIAGVASSQEPAAIADFIMATPAGVQVGDLLVAMCARDNTTGTITCNWTIPSGGNITAGSIRMACAYIRVTSLPVNPCNFYNATADEWAGCVYIIRDYNYISDDSDFIDAVGNNNDTAGPPYDCTALDINYANSLMLIAVGLDGAVNPVPSGGNIVVEDAQDAGTVSFLSGWSIEPTDGSTDAIPFIGTATNNSFVFLKFAIRNATNGRVPVVPASTIHDVIDTGYHRERANAYVNETVLTNFLGWGIRDPDYVYQDDGGVFTDFTTAATDDTDADVFFPTTEAINDALYIGDAEKFGGMLFDRAGCTAGGSGALAWEYWNGSAWVVLPKQYTTSVNNFNASVGDKQAVSWQTPLNWATTIINGQSAYWIRLRITVVYTTNPTISRIYICDKPVYYDAAAAVADTGVVPFWSSIAISPGTTNIGVHTAAIRDLGTTLDLNVAERYLIGTYVFTSPREYYDTGSAELGYGVRMPWLDSSNYHKSWIIGGFAYPQCIGDKRNIWAIQFSQTTDTSHSTGQSAPDFNNARKWVITQGSYADEVTNIYHSYMAFVNRAILQGGDSNGLANWSDVKRAINGTLFPYYNGGQIYIPVQFGGGKVCKVDIDLATFDFVRAAGSPYGGMIHIDPGVLGVIINGTAGDIIKIRNSTITSESLIRFEVDAASSSGATYDFSGTTVVNANVTLQALTFMGMNFINCPTFTQNSATLTDCNFTNTKVTSATLADMDNISGCSFTSGGTGHAIEVGGSANTITFSGNEFNGYASSNGSTGNEAIFVNIATGTVTINISGGGDTPSIRTAGATVNVISGATVTFTGLPTGCDIVILTAGTSTILDQVDAHGSTSYSWNYQGTPTIDVGFIKPGYVVYYIRNLSLTTTDSSIPVTLTPDRNYQ